MRKLNFESTKEFEHMFGHPNEEVADAVAEAIQEAVSYQKKTAKLFEVSFNNVEYVYEITLPSKEWGTALDTCLKFYEKVQQHDKALDTYLLKKEVDKWLS